MRRRDATAEVDCRGGGRRGESRWHQLGGARHGGGRRGDGHRLYSLTHLFLFSIVSSETIAVIKLDDVIVPEDPVFLFKMDAQGYEPTVLDGASRVLMENSPSILTFEFWPKGIDRGVGQDPKEMLTHLWDSGYHCFDWSTNMHIPDSRPSDVVGFVNSFYDLGNFPGSKCQSQTCQGFGLWDELVCAKL